MNERSAIAVGVSLGTLNPRSWREVALSADRLGVESVWVSDHLVAPVRAAGRLGSASDSRDAEAARMGPSTPLTDSVGYLCYLAALTSRVQLGTYVYLLGLRHPFVGARGFATLDRLSEGRALLGVGAGWLESEWDALGIPPATRGERLDEAISVCRRLWGEEVVGHAGEHFGFEPVGFEPKPSRPGGIPVLVGGESRRALERAARLGDGWLGMAHTPRSAAERVALLRRLRADAGRGEESFSITVAGAVAARGDLAAYAAAGVDRVMVTPWTSSRTAADDLAGFARSVLTAGADRPLIDQEA